MENGTRKWGDLGSGLALAALGTFIIVRARQWDYLVSDGPGAGFFPLWYGIAMLALSTVLVVSGLRRGFPRKEPHEWSKSGRALSAWLALAISVALCKLLGFLASFALLTFFIVAVLYRRPPRIAAIVAISGAVGFYLVFPLLLGMVLPVGILGF